GERRGGDVLQRIRSEWRHADEESQEGGDRDELFPGRSCGRAARPGKARVDAAGLTSGFADHDVIPNGLHLSPNAMVASRSIQPPVPLGTSSASSTRSSAIVVT